MMPLRHVTYWMGFLFGLLVAFSPGAFIYMMNEPSPIVTARFEVLTPSVAPGEELRLEVATEVSKRCKGTVWRSIIDSTGVQTNYEPVDRPADPEFNVSLTVPLGAAPGLATYQTRVEWQCNFVQAMFPRTVQLRPATFTIKTLSQQLPNLEKQGIYTKPTTAMRLAQETMDASITH